VSSKKRFFRAIVGKFGVYNVYKRLVGDGELLIHVESERSPLRNAISPENG
jgi:hypothetical protein